MLSAQGTRACEHTPRTIVAFNFVMRCSSPGQDTVGGFANTRTSCFVLDVGSENMLNHAISPRNADHRYMPCWNSHVYLTKTPRRTFAAYPGLVCCGHPLSRRCKIKYLTTPPLRSSLFSSCNLFSAPGVRRLCRKLEPLLTLYKSSQRNAPYLLLEPLTLISTPDTLKTSSASLSAPPLTIIHKKWRTHLMAVS